MKLNIFNNFRAIYYNTLVNFYLYFNTVVPYYDDVIISLSITSFKNILNNNLSLKTIKQNRMIHLLYSLNGKDDIVLDDEGYINIEYNDGKIETNEVCVDSSDDTDTVEDTTTAEDATTVDATTVDTTTAEDATTVDTTTVDTTTVDTTTADDNAPTTNSEIYNCLDKKNN